MRTFYDVTTGSPGKAPTEYDSKQWPREEPASAYYGMRPVYGNTRHRRNVPDNHVPQPFTPPPTPPLEWWEIPLDEAMPEQAPIQDVSYLCTQADLLLHADKAEWIKTQLRDGWATLCRAPSHRRVDRSVVITPQSSKGQAVRRQITWAKSMGYHYSNVLPVLPGTQVYRATGAIKYAYSRNDPDDPRSRSWKARGVMNGGIHAQGKLQVFPGVDGVRSRVDSPGPRCFRGKKNGRTRAEGERIAPATMVGGPRRRRFFFPLGP